VYEAGILHRYSGSTPEPTGSVDAGLLFDSGTAAVVGAELWVRRADAQVVAIDRQDLSTRELDVPAGQLVGSDGRAWLISPGPDGSTARQLDADGAELHTVTITGSRDASAWADGRGGLWLTGSALVSSGSGTDQGVVIDVVSRPFAVHVSSNGAVSGTWWAGDVRNQGTWFTPAGDGLGLADGAGLTLVHR
jgi:hypothetical protein